MNIVQVQKIHLDPTVIYTIGGKLDHVTYVIAATYNISYFILKTCIVFFCITAPTTISPSLLLPPLKVDPN